MRIYLHDLKQLSEKLLAHLEATEQLSFDIEDDYYWDIPPAQRYDVGRDPTSMTIGQLGDDWRQLSLLVANSEREPVGAELVQLAAILRAVGENAL